MHDAATAVRGALDELADWGDAGTRPGQYKSDLAADAVVVAALEAAGLGVMSEESGVHHGDREVIVVVDPVDGSTNASRSLALVRHELVRGRSGGGPRCRGRRPGQRDAVRGRQGRGRAGRRSPPRPVGLHGDGGRGRGALRISAAPVGLEAVPGASVPSPSICAPWRVGGLDAYVDCSPSAHGPWDYLGGLLVCREAGATIVDAFDRPLVTTDHSARLTPIAAATPQLLDQAVTARRGFVDREAWAAERALLT
jgi:hypothetical protein